MHSKMVFIVYKQIQGPLAAPVLQMLTKEDLSKFYFSEFCMLDINGYHCFLTRTGYILPSLIWNLTLFVLKVYSSCHFYSGIATMFNILHLDLYTDFIYQNRQCFLLFSLAVNKLSKALIGKFKIIC